MSEFDWTYQDGGLTLLDLFAGFALAGARASDRYASASPEATAADAYRDAAAMLKERERLAEPSS